jgi:putative ABC transport system ATP-binding protein
MLDADINFENYLDEDASGGIMLESYNEKKNKGDFTLSFSGNKTKKDEIYLWDKEYIEFEKAYTCKNIKKEGEIDMALLEVKNVKKIYTTRFGGNKVEALRDVNFSVEPGEYVAIMGESGSGKSTLLNILAQLDRPTSGKVILKGRDLSTIKEKEMSAFRRQNLGFVFQDFHLLDTFTLKDNIFLPLVLSGRRYEEMEQRLAPIARHLGIEKILEKYPYEVSGGQKQRVAVARALIIKPQIILADEPTGALDSKAAQELLRLFSSVNHDGQTILMVTHSVKAASSANRVMFIKDGEVFHQLYRGNLTDEQMYQKISDTLTVLEAGGEHVE